MKRLTQPAPVLAFHDAHCGAVRRDGVRIHFRKTHDRIHPENTSCYLYVQGVDAWDEEMHQAWGMRDFAILDVHGNLLRIGEPIASETNGR